MAENKIKSFADIPILGRISALVPFFRTPAPMPPSTKEELKAPTGLVDPGRLLQGWLVFPYNPSWLASRKGLAIYDVMKRDEQVKAALKFKKHTVVVPGWELISPKGKDHDWNVSEFVRWTFNNMDDGFVSGLNKIMTALDYGFSVQEKIYEEVPNGKWKGKICLKKLNSIKPHFIHFIQDEFGRLLAVRQYNVHFAVHDMPPDKFCIYTYSKEFENYYGQSDLEAAYRAWWVKDNAYKWLAVALERYGMPPLFAFFNPDAYQPEQIANLKQVITNIQNGTFGILPRKVKDDLDVWTQTIGRDSNTTFVNALRRFDDDIAKALLMPGLIGFTSDHQSSGSHARSAQQFKSFIQVVLHLQVDIAERVINSQVIPQLCDLNFPGLSEYPKFRFMPFEDENKMDVLKTWLALVEGRVVNRVDDDEAHIRQIMDFPDNPDPVLQPLPLPKGSGGMPGGAAGGGDNFGGEFGGGGDGMGGGQAPSIPVGFAEYADQPGHPFRGNQWSRVQAALDTHKPVTAAKQRLAAQSESRVGKLLEGTTLEDHEPMDVVVRIKGRLHGVEVKTFADNANDKLTMHPESLERKVKWGKTNGAVLHTVVVDKRGTFASGQHSSSYSGHELWYRRGVGSFRLKNMVPVRDAEHLRELMHDEK